MQYFNFYSLIEKYTVDFAVEIASDGYYDAKGDWQIGEVLTIPKRGAIISLTSSKIYHSNGVLTQKDKQLFMKEKLCDDFTQAQVVFNGDKYKVEQDNASDNSPLTGVFAYVLRYVSAFGEGER